MLEILVWCIYFGICGCLNYRGYEDLYVWVLVFIIVVVKYIFDKQMNE